MANLEVKVGIDNKPFKSGLDQMKADASKFKNGMPGMFGGAFAPFTAMANKVKAGFSGIFTSIKGGLASLGAMVGVGAITKTITDTIAYGDALSDLSTKLGVSSTSLQAWKHHVEQNGASLEGLAAAMAKVEVNRSKALQGDEKMIQSFADLGVSIEDLESMSLDEIMMKIGSSTMDASTMVAVMGKNALDLKAALAGAAEEGLNFSNVMSEQTVEALGKVADAWTEFKGWFTKNMGEFLASILDAGSIIFTGKPYVVKNKEGEEKRKRAMERLAKSDEEPTEKAKKDAEKREEGSDIKQEIADKIKERESEVKDLEGKKSGALRAATSIPVDSLQAVGGGRGGFGGVGNQQLRLTERQLSVAQQSLNALQQIASMQGKKEADPWR